MFGKGYVKDICITLFQKEQEEKAVRIYYGECLRTISENTAKFGGGAYIQAKLQDILDPKPVDKRTAEDIIEGIRKKL
jgi:hypothetical protein